MLTGSFAGAYYGASRSTQDVDFVIDPSPVQLQMFVQLLVSPDYYSDLEDALRALDRRSMFNVLDLVSGWKIDFILRKSRDFSKVEFQRRLSVEIQGLQLFVATPEDVILAKLEWAKLGGSQRQIEDVAAILRGMSPGLDMPYMSKWVAELGLGEQWERLSQP